MLCLQINSKCEAHTPLPNFVYTYELLVEGCSLFTVMFNNCLWGNGDTIKVTCSTRTLQSMCKPSKIRGLFLLNYSTLLQKKGENS